MAAEQPDPNVPQTPDEPSEPMNRKQRRANAVIKRRQTHKEVVEEIEEPDVFVQQGRPVVDWVVDHTRELAIGLGAIVGILFLWGAISTLQAGKAEDAAEALYRAHRKLPALTATEESNNDDLKEGLAALEGVIDEYGNTAQADQARVEAAGIAYQLGDNDKALALADAATGADGVVGLQALSSKAYALEAKGDLAGAASALEALQKKAEGGFKAQAMLDLARVLEAQGKGAEAKTLLEGFEEEFPDSLLLPDAKARLASLQ